MRRYRLIGTAGAIAILILTGIGAYESRRLVPAAELFMEIRSFAFSEGDDIPADYTCDGKGTSPELSISGVPADAKSLVLIMDDPDAPAGTWVHWTIWNIASSIASIVPDSVPAGAREGMTSFGESGYGGPCPHQGAHRYYFRLFALDRMLDLPAGASIGDLRAAMGRPIAEAVLVGRYARPTETE